MEVDKEAYRKHFPELLPMKVEKCEMTVNQFGKYYMMARQRERERRPSPRAWSRSEAGSRADESAEQRQELRHLLREVPHDLQLLRRRVSPSSSACSRTSRSPRGPWSSTPSSWRAASAHQAVPQKHQLSFSEITGKVSADQQRGIILSFNSADNAHGERIKALLISKTGAEGLSLKRVRQVHILEPYWDWSRHDQVEARRAPGLACRPA